jgi:hypothetical protein
MLFDETILFMYVCQLKSKFQVEMEISIVQNISVLVLERCQQLCCRFEVDISVDMLVKFTRLGLPLVRRK